VQHAAIHKAYEAFLRQRELKYTAQRRRILDRAYATHEHFSAERLYFWLKQEPGPSVSRATVYRTLALLVEGGFLESLDTGTGELVYEHVLGHTHHDHLVCLGCGRIEEFRDDRIEQLQRENCARLGFVMVSHVLKLSGYCKSCARKRKDAGAKAPAAAATRRASAAASAASV
jgi:Fur family ferric uptake transcriptional regulator